MKVEGAAALVTGANRGLGAAIAQALLDAGAKVYGAARDPATITNQGLIAVPLDVTDGDDIAIAARTCRDVSILVNNAIDWQSRQCSLKASFPLVVSNPLATYDSQVGAIERGNNEPKKFEVPQHRWLDLTDAKGDYGVGIDRKSVV